MAVPCLPGWRLVLVLSVALGAARVAAQRDAIPVWTYDTEYLNTWAVETFVNDSFPVEWWDTNLPPCPAVGVPGFLGVTCRPPTRSGRLFVTGIDLSTARLPKGSKRLLGQLQRPPAIVGLKFLVSLNMSGQGLYGPLEKTIAKAPRLKRLDFKNNTLSGTIPVELCGMNLDCINLSYNNFKGSIPKCFKTFPCVDFRGNPKLNMGNCDKSNTNPSCKPRKPRRHRPPPSRKPRRRRPPPPSRKPPRRA